MAEPLIDFSLDPFQTEEDILNQRLKEAVAKRLAASQKQVINPYDAVMSGMDRSSSEREMRNIEDERRRLSKKFEDDLYAVAKTQSAEVNALLMNPATRAQGLAAMAEERKRRYNLEDYETANRLFAPQTSVLPGAMAATGGQSPIPSREQLMQLVNHPNPQIAKRAELMLKEYYTPQDPTKTQYIQPGGAVSVPGMETARQSAKAADEQIKANLDIVEIPDGKGGKMYVTRAQAVKMFGPQATQLPPVGSGAAPIGPGGPTPVPAEGVAPGALTPRATPPPQPLTSQSTIPGTEATDEVMSRQVQPLTLEQEKLIAQYQASKAPAPSGQRMPIDFAQGPPTIVRPQGPVGSIPPGMKEYEETAKQEREQLANAQKNWGTLPATGSALEKMQRAHAGGMPGGGLSSLVAQGWDWLTSGKTGGMPEFANAREFDSAAKQLAASFIKQFGSNPSNRDLQAAMAILPQATDSPRTREQFMVTMKRAYEFEQAAAQHVPGLVQKGYSVPQSYEMVRQWFDERVPPVAPVSEKGKALPSTMGQLSPKGEPPQGGSLTETLSKINAVLYPTLHPITPSKELPSGSPQQFLSGAGDAWANTVRGIGQLAGQYSEEDWKKEEERQKAFAEQSGAYKAGNITGSVLDPLGIISGSKPLKIVGNTVVGVGQGLAQPAGSTLDRIENATLGGVGGAVGGLLGPLVGPTVQKGSKEFLEKTKALLKEFPSFNPKSTQIASDMASRATERLFGTGRAAYGDQTAAITKDLMASAGLKGERLSQDVIENGYKRVDSELAALFSKSIKAKIEDADKAVLSGTIGHLKTVEDAMGKAPTLSMIHEVLTDKGANIQSIKASSLLDAWREADKLPTKFSAEAEEIKSVLRPLIDKVIPKNQAGKFDDLIRQGREIADIDRVWRAGGSSAEGAYGGYINPSKLVLEAGTGPFRGSKIDKAAELVAYFKVHNPRDETFNPMNILDYTRSSGGLVGKMDYTGARSSEMDQLLAKVLRGAVQQAPIQGLEQVGE